MYCSNCGAWNPEESEFCAKCGRPLQAASKQRQTKRTGLCLVIAIAGVLLFVAIVAVGAFLVRDHLARIWQGFTAQPTQVAVIPTPLPTEAPIQATVTPTLLPSPSPISTELPTPTPSLTPTQKATPPQPTFKLVYRECIPHGLSLGSVKGQVFDKKGKVIPGAKVRIMINDYEWESEANPATTNSEGWYEWILEPGQRVKFVELIVAGQSVPFSPRDFEVEATGGCFQRVDFEQQD